MSTHRVGIGIVGLVVAAVFATSAAYADRGAPRSMAMGDRLGSAEMHGFVVSYHKPPKRLISIARYVRKNRVLEGFVEPLNRRLELPRLVRVKFASCGQANAFYSPSKHSIIMCYELVDELFRHVKSEQRWESNKELVAKTMGLTRFVFMHELGHALANELDLPITGREEDAVDQLATAILLEDPKGAELIYKAGTFFNAQTNPKNLKFWDNHSIGPVRFVNFACWVYGKNPKRYRFLEKQLSRRARRCKKEYGAMARAWGRLLAPHMNRAVASKRSRSSLSCARTIKHFAKLAMAKEMQTMTRSQKIRFLDMAKQTMSNVVSQQIRKCERKRLSKSWRRCVLRSKNMRQASRCDAVATR